MTNQAHLKAEIEVEGGTLKVGANPQPPNQFTLSITNQGEPVKWTKNKPLSLTICLGSGKEALFLDENDARKCVRSIPTGWKADWDFSGKNGGSDRLKIYSFQNPLKKDETLSIEFKKVVSKTDPEGSAHVSLESDSPAFKQELSISKKADVPGIIYLISDPEEGVQNFPGDSVTLKWRTYNLTNQELTQGGSADPLSCDFSKDEGTKTIDSGSANTTFRLRGYAGSKPIDRELKVEVLSSGWHNATNTIFEGDPGYPSPENEHAAQALERDGKRCDLEPTLLLNANEQLLYAVFRHIFQGKERAFLFQTKNPFDPWQFVNSSVPNQQGGIPEGFSTSPGVYCDDKLWLIGGSQIDPDNTSNSVWCFDPKKEAWENRGAAAWSPRMGHAVLWFPKKSQIWVMGGRDETGNALNDVWTLDATTNEWTSLDQAHWDPRCLFNPAVFRDQIWLYGGAQEPFSSKLYNDVWVYSDSGNWTEKKLTGIITGTTSRKPIASCLQVFNDKLHLFGKFRTINSADKSEKVEPLAFSLSSPSTKTWDSFSNDGLKNWGGDTTFSYQLVAFKNKILIAKALSYEAVNPVMKVYVP